MQPQGTKKKALRKRNTKDLDSNQSSLAGEGDTVSSTVPIKKITKKIELKDYSKSLKNAAIET